MLNDTGTTGGFLVLGGVNTYTGGTTIAANNSSGLSISADSGRLANLPGTATPGFRTLNNCVLLTTATFTLNANRGSTLFRGSPFRRGHRHHVDLPGVVAGTGPLSTTSALVRRYAGFGGVNTYSGGTQLRGRHSQRRRHDNRALFGVRRPRFP